MTPKEFQKWLERYVNKGYNDIKIKINCSNEKCSNFVRIEELDFIGFHYFCCETCKYETIPF